ncbi:hypothetical protein B0H67DRAFT_183648 [Lasiosphaeris hirsuta]|uniref:Uncharacterized protein n=1 Tax=Lasiosphaeris hirsuta TaxID=260670 RepID=A0AA40AQU7_9PEZI|nr:hypothetical protein B0H67DRAFT_183648 [Lasiosphaeris hirsuta]
MIPSSGSDAPPESHHSIIPSYPVGPAGGSLRQGVRLEPCRSELLFGACANGAPGLGRKRSRS